MTKVKKTMVREFLQEVYPAVEKREKWGVFDRVRSSKIVDITKDNIIHFLPKIEECHSHSELKNDRLEKLYNGDPESIEEFRKHQFDGILFPNFRETVSGKPSPHDQIWMDFMRKGKKNDPVYTGKCLMDDKGEILAWLFYWQTLNKPSAFHRKETDKYLRHGLTEGKTYYPVDQRRENLRNLIDHILRFDIMQQRVKLAMARLFAHTLQSMLTQNPELMTMILCIQLEIVTNPEIILPNMSVPIAPNPNSSLFFQGLSCRTHGASFYKDGQTAKRQLNNGITMELNPAWEEFSGDIWEMHLRAWQKWRGIQYAFGDLTNDGYDPKLVLKRPDYRLQLNRKKQD